MASRILGWLLGLLFVAAGVPKLLGAESVVQEFQRFGYGPTFRLLIGVLETAGGIGMFVPAVARYANLGLLAIMAGATWTLIRVGASPAPPLIVGALLALSVYLRERAARPQ